MAYTVLLNNDVDTNHVKHLSQLVHKKNDLPVINGREWLRPEYRPIPCLKNNTLLLRSNRVCCKMFNEDRWQVPFLSNNYSCIFISVNIDFIGVIDLVGVQLSMGFHWWLWSWIFWVGESSTSEPGTVFHASCCSYRPLHHCQGLTVTHTAHFDYLFDWVQRPLALLGFIDDRSLSKVYTDERVHSARSSLEVYPSKYWNICCLK